MASESQSRVVTYVDSRRRFTGFVVFGVITTAATVASSQFGVQWLLVGMAAAVVAALTVAKRMSSTTWRVSEGEGILEVQFGTERDIFRLEEVKAAGTWEMTDSLQELVLDFRDDTSVGIPLYATELLLALGRELRLRNSEIKATQAAQEVLGWNAESR